MFGRCVRAFTPAPSHQYSMPPEEKAAFDRNEKRGFGMTYSDVGEQFTFDDPA